jgi:hypothetical protein
MLVACCLCWYCCCRLLDKGIPLVRLNQYCYRK